MDGGELCVAAHAPYLVCMYVGMFLLYIRITESTLKILQTLLVGSNCLEENSPFRYARFGNDLIVKKTAGIRMTTWKKPESTYLSYRERITNACCH